MKRLGSSLRRTNRNFRRNRGNTLIVLACRTSVEIGGIVQMALGTGQTVSRGATGRILWFRGWRVIHAAGAGFFQQGCLNRSDFCRLCSCHVRCHHQSPFTLDANGGSLTNSASNLRAVATFSYASKGQGELLALRPTLFRPITASACPSSTSAIPRGGRGRAGARDRVWPPNPLPTKPLRSGPWLSDTPLTRNGCQPKDSPAELRGIPFRQLAVSVVEIMRYRASDARAQNPD